MAALFGAAGAAHAQSCAPQGDTGAVCRLVLSEPRVFMVRASARLTHRARRLPHMIITVDGLPCRGIWYSTRVGARAECRRKFPAATSVIEVLVYGQTDVVHTRGVNVTLTADDSLGAIPREGRDLYPKVQRRPFRLPSPPWRHKPPPPPPESAPQ